MKRTQAELDALPDSSFCGPDRSFPVGEEADVADALQSLGRADPGDRESIRACVIRKAQEHHWTLPAATQEQVDGGRGGKKAGGADSGQTWEYKTLAMVPTAINDRQVTGVFAVYGNRDRMGDVAHPGSLAKTLREAGRKAFYLWHHRAGEPPIAVVDSLRELRRDELPADLLGEYPEATGGGEVTRTYLDTPRGNEVLAAIKAGAPLHQSYAFRAVKYEHKTAPDGVPERHLYEQAVGEISDVGLLAVNLATRARKATGDGEPLDEWLAGLAELLAEVKAGARHSLADVSRLNKVHDLIKELGCSNCPTAEPDADDGTMSRAAQKALTPLADLRADLDLFLLSVAAY